MPARRGATLDDQIDALFRLSLGEFTAARNALAARLGKEGRAIEARRVKSLAKPTAPAWAVNQVYWQNPKAVDQLLVLSEKIRKAQTGRAKNLDVRELLGEKKRMMGELMGRAATILREAGHSASPDAMRRVSGSLESLAMWGTTEGAPRAGRLVADLDPPGFDALAAVMSGEKIDPARVLPFRAPQPAEDPAAARAKAREEAKAAEKALREARRRAAAAEGALAKANARAAALEKQKEEIEARWAEARDEARAASSEVQKATRAVADAERSLARAKESPQ